MDSFYDAPRKLPQIPSRNRLPSVPLVPEISVLCSSEGPQKPSNDFATYNQWKTAQNHPYQHWMTSNKENAKNTPNLNPQYCNQQNTSYLKKQVRFESPVLQQRLTYEPILPKNNHNLEVKKSVDPHLMRFEQMYLANIPNRQLDLSVIDLPSGNLVQNTQKQINKFDQVQENKKVDEKLTQNEEQHPKTYKEFKESQKTEFKETPKLEADKIIINDSVTDIFNYKRSPATPVRPIGRFHPKVDDCVSEKRLDFSKTPQKRTENDPLKTPNDDLTNKYFPTTDTNPKLNFDYLKTPNKHNFEFKQNKPTEHTVQQNLGLENRVGNNENFNRHHFEQGKNSFEQNPCNRAVENFVFEDKERHSKENFEKINKCCCIKDSDSRALVVKNDDEPSVRDLLKIISQQSQQIAQQNQQISQQNEQLLNLQKQVGVLITRQTRNDEEMPNRYLTGNQTEAYHFTNNNVQETPRKNNKRAPQGFSIDFTTSVSFRGNFQNKNPNFVPKTQENFSSRIQEISESCGTSERSYDNRTEGSMVFGEPIKVRESCPSPEPSIKIDEMKDFEDSDAETSDSDCSEIGPSFYKNLMAQVNNVLQQAQIQTTEPKQNNQMFNGKITNKTIHKVKEATMRHLRSIGVSVPEFDETTSSSYSSEENISYDQSDVSFAVKQLLMKYLPDEHLAKVALKEPENLALVAQENIGAIKARPDFSFATVQYMKKYNLIAGSNKGPPRINVRQTPKSSNNDKILDISRLKQQPKLI